MYIHYTCFMYFCILEVQLQMHEKFVILVTRKIWDLNIELKFRQF